MCLGEVAEGKKFDDVEVEELEAEVTEANGMENQARTGGYTGKNWSGKVRRLQEHIWPRAFSCKYISLVPISVAFYLDMSFRNVLPPGVANTVLVPSLVVTKQNNNDLYVDQYQDSKTDKNLFHVRLCGWKVLWVPFPVIFTFAMPRLSQDTTPEELDAPGACKFVNLSSIPTWCNQATKMK